MNYLYSDDPLLLNEDRISHDSDKSICSQNHESFPFLTRCQWLLFATLRRSIIPLQNFREKVCRNLAHLLPGGYETIGSVNPEHYVSVMNIV